LVGLLRCLVQTFGVTFVCCCCGWTLHGCWFGYGCVCYTFVGLILVVAFVGLSTRLRLHVYVLVVTLRFVGYPLLLFGWLFVVGWFAHFVVVARWLRAVGLRWLVRLRGGWLGHVAVVVGCWLLLNYICVVVVDYWTHLRLLLFATLRIWLLR